MKNFCIAVFGLALISSCASIKGRDPDASARNRSSQVNKDAGQKSNVHAETKAKAIAFFDHVLRENNLDEKFEIDPSTYQYSDPNNVTDRIFSTLFYHVIYAYGAGGAECKHHQIHYVPKLEHDIRIECKNANGEVLYHEYWNDVDPY